MARYVASRLVQLVVICFLISVFAFLLVHLLPGDPTLSILGPNDTPAARHILLKQLGLNKGLVAQYGTWISNIFHGNLGASFLTKQTVTNALSEAVPIDLELIVVSQLLALVIAIPMALIASLRPNRPFDRVATTATFGMLALPTFVAGPLLVLVFAVTLHWAPATGFVRLSQGLGPNLKSVILPSVALAIGSITIYYRLLRADLIATLQEDFVTMARLEGPVHALHPAAPRAAPLVVLVAGRGRHQHRNPLHRGLRRGDPLPAAGHRLPARAGHLLP